MIQKIRYFFSALLISAVIPTMVSAQQPAPSSVLYEQATEVSGLVVQYLADVEAIDRFYGPMVSGSGGRRGGASVHSPEQSSRLQKLNESYLEKLRALDFDNFSVYGQVDYVLLKRKIEASQEALALEESNRAKIARWIPFADSIYTFEKLRRRGTSVDGEQIAASLNGALLQLEDTRKVLEGEGEMDAALSDYASATIVDLQQRLKNAFDFYNGYDPDFTWWTPAPYKALDAALTAYAGVVADKSDAKPFDDGSNIGGKPIGREAFAKELRDNMIPYTPEELLKLADQEFAWCEAELLKASREMGFGDDWKAAQEKVKNSYVPAGEQPELIIKLYNDAIDFYRKNDLITIPPLADETWGMVMMTPEQQLVSPFFLGGRNIMISYPTETMAHGDKLMSMRGNNPYFSRGTVQHELVPGHHLQHYVNSRYKPYRASAFRTPFWTEGWALYTELMLYDLGFAKTPEERIGMLFWRMHRCARIAFSIKFHLGEWTPQQCVDYLVDRVGHERANAEGEVRRSFEGNYGAVYQLAYLTGGLQLWGLKKELVDSGKMTYKEFHDRIMKENCMPIEMVRATLTNQKLDRDFESSWKFYDFN